MKFSELIGVLGEAGDARRAGDPEIRGVQEDSRRVGPGDLFVARSGTKVSGSQFAIDAVARGAAAVVSAEKLELPGHVAFVQVADAARAVGVLAQRFYGDPARRLRTMAVTGTNGKTTITYLIRAILQAAGKKCGLVGTVQIDDGAQVVESTMTTPGAAELAELMARMVKNGAGHCVMEVSSHALDQQRVAGMEFAAGMFTNLTGDHLDYHKTMENYAAAKAKLFAELGKEAVAVVNADDAWAGRMVRDCRAKVVRYGLKEQAEWGAEIRSMTSAGMNLLVRGPGVEFILESPLVGRYNVANTLCAAATTYALGMPPEAIVAGLRGMGGAPGRLQAVVPAGRGRSEMAFQVFVDYAHTHDALENVLLALRPLTRGRLICVFGCGGDRDRTKRPKMAAVAEKLADLVFLTSDNPRTEDPQAILREVAAGFSATGRGKVTVEADRRAAIGAAVGAAGAGDVVLIAGKGHENYQILGTTKHHFDDVEEAEAALLARGNAAAVV